MRYLVTYASKYGGSRQYARWIAEALECEARDIKTVTAGELAGCDVIIHGGGLYAGSLSGLGTIKKYWRRIAQKQVILFSCGLADPADAGNAATIEKGITRAMKPGMRGKVRQFHFRSGIDYSRLSRLHTMMMEKLCQWLARNGYENMRQEDRLMVDTFGKKADFADRDSIAPLIEYVKTLG